MAAAALVLATSITSVAALAGAAWASPHLAGAPLPVRPPAGTTTAGTTTPGSTTPGTTAISSTAISSTAISSTAISSSAVLAVPVVIPSQTAAPPAPAAGVRNARAVMTRRPTARTVRPQVVVDAAQIGMASNGIPTVALNAYRVAEARMASAAPAAVSIGR